MCKVVDTGHSIKTGGLSLGFSARTLKRKSGERRRRGCSLASHELTSIHPFPLNKPGCCNLAQCRALAIARESYYFIGSSLFPTIRVCDISLVCSTAPTFVCPAERRSFSSSYISLVSLRATRAHRISRY